MGAWLCKQSQTRGKGGILLVIAAGELTLEQ
uniref:Uncharacterized protein n=1 Tax=Anguilla anguilla TaxID=7936 RepID=A0A0E9VAQ7_ANGAN